MKAILQGKFGEVAGALGCCCSSFVVASRGSTGRSFLTPMGCLEFNKVKAANCLGARTDSRQSETFDFHLVVSPCWFFRESITTGNVFTFPGHLSKRRLMFLRNGPF